LRAKSLDEAGPTCNAAIAHDRHASIEVPQDFSSLDPELRGNLGSSDST